MKIVSVIALGAFLLCQSTAQAAVTICTLVNRVKSDASSWFPNAKIVELGGDEARGFIIAANAVKPVSQVVGDYVISIMMPDKPIVVAVVFQGGCAVATWYLPAETYKSLLREL